MPRRFNCYPTFEEASAAFIKIVKKYNLSVNNTGTAYIFYTTWYKEDPRLPSNPNIIYRRVWKQKGSWNGFFQRKPKEKNYYSYKEAVKAIQKWRVPPKNFTNYRINCKKFDLRLPFHPQKYYPDFEKRGGWDAYLLLGEIYKKKNPKYYDSIEEAKKAVLNLMIINEEMYFQERWRDPKLPPNLKIYYGPYNFARVFGKASSFKLQE